MMNSLNVLFLALIVALAQQQTLVNAFSLPTSNVVVNQMQQQLPSVASNVQEGFGSTELVSVLDGLKGPIQSYVDIW